MKIGLFAATSFFVLSRVAGAHGPVIPLTQTSPGVISTYAFDLDGNDADGYTPTTATRAFPIVPLALQSSAAYPNDGGWYGQLEATQPSNGEDTTFLGPGLAFGQGGFTSTTVFRVSFAEGAKVWSGADNAFVVTGGETIQGLRGNFSTVGFANTLRSDGVQTGTGVLTGAVGTNNPGNHSQIRWRVDGPNGSPVASASNAIDDGLYLASLQVGAYEGAAAATLYATSATFYLLFEKNAAGGVSLLDEANAQAALAAIVPEPSGVALLGIAAAWIGRQRTRRP